jgi:hypothetical protein
VGEWVGSVTRLIVLVQPGRSQADMDYGRGMRCLA